MGKALSKTHYDPKCMKELTDKEYRFVHEYVKDHNGKRAAVAAGYSEKSASVLANRNLKKPRVKESIAFLMKELMRQCDLTAEETVRQLFWALTRDVGGFFRNGRVLRPDELPANLSSIVDGFKARQNTDPETGEVTSLEVEYKLTPHAVAREQALKYLGMYEPGLIGEKADVDWDSMYNDDGVADEEVREVQAYIEE